MMSREVKYFRGKIVPHLGLQAGTTSRDFLQNERSDIKILQWNVGGLSQAKKIKINKMVND